MLALKWSSQYFAMHSIASFRKKKEKKKKKEPKTLNEKNHPCNKVTFTVCKPWSSVLVLYRLYTQTPQGRMDSPALAALRERFNLGAVISGTSAGTECQPNKLMINSRHRLTKNKKCLSWMLYSLYKNMGNILNKKKYLISLLYICSWGFYTYIW